jgi:hypothetical protein
MFNKTFGIGDLSLFGIFIILLVVAISDGAHF